MNLSMEGKAMTKNVANPEDKDEVWKKSGFAGRVQSLRENGLRKDDIGIYLTPEQEEFLREATWESYRKIQLREVPGRMSNAQYKMKSDLIASWRALPVSFPIGSRGRARSLAFWRRRPRVQRTFP